MDYERPYSGTTCKMDQRLRGAVYVADFDHPVYKTDCRVLVAWGTVRNGSLSIVLNWEFIRWIQTDGCLSLILRVHPY